MQSFPCKKKREKIAKYAPFSLLTNKTTSHNKWKAFSQILLETDFAFNRYKNNSPVQSLRDMKVILDVNF